MSLPPADTHTKFNPQQSSTYSANGQTFYLPYGAGSLSGVFGYDTVNVSPTITTLQIPNYFYHSYSSLHAIKSHNSTCTSILIKPKCFHDAECVLFVTSLGRWYCHQQPGDWSEYWRARSEFCCGPVWWYPWPVLPFHLSRTRDSRHGQHDVSEPSAG